MKKIFTIILLGFVTISIIVMVYKIMASEQGGFETNILPENAVIVYYFHTDYRCETCELIEKNTGDAVVEKFSSDINSGKILWKVVNTDAAVNKHYVKDYELYSGAVILSKRVLGKEVSYKDLDKIWELAYDEVEFKNYISSEIRKFIESK